MRRRAASVLLGSTIALGLAACGGEAAPAASDAAAVQVSGFEFRPGDLRVAAGDEVVWENEDDIAHTVTSGTTGEQGVPGVSADVQPSPDGTFDLELAERGATASFTFAEAGEYAYFCEIHNGMSGTVTVAAA